MIGISVGSGLLLDQSDIRDRDILAVFLDL